MATYHLSEDGNPRRCTASKGNCPLTHSEDPVALRRQFEQEMEAGQSTIVTLQKVTSSYAYNGFPTDAQGKRLKESAQKMNKVKEWIGRHGLKATVAASSVTGALVGATSGNMDAAGGTAIGVGSVAALGLFTLREAVGEQAKEQAAAAYKIDRMWTSESQVSMNHHYDENVSDASAPEGKRLSKSEAKAAARAFMNRENLEFPFRNKVVPEAQPVLVPRGPVDYEKYYYDEAFDQFFLRADLKAEERARADREGVRTSFSEQDLAFLADTANYWEENDNGEPSGAWIVRDQVARARKGQATVEDEKQLISLLNRFDSGALDARPRGLRPTPDPRSQKMNA